jgi:uncharacterized protein (TIGR02001 family)
MWKILAAAMATLGLGYSTALATPPDTSSMPQLALPPATPPEPPVSGPVFAFTATAASNYVFRGISQTENGAAVFGSGRVSYNDIYAGVGIENVDFHNSTKAEYDLSAGWTPVLDGFRFDLGVVRYGYIDQPAHTEIDTAEVKAVVLHDFGPVTLGAAVYYSGNYFGSHRDDVYGEGRAAYRITPKLTFGGAVGRQSGGSADHTTWNAGATYAFAKHLALRYADTDEHQLGKTYRSHFVASIKAAF